MKKILLIDDSEDTFGLVKATLIEYQLSGAFSMSQAETALQNTLYDLVLIDIGLPDGNGFDLCRRLTHDLKYMNVPKILLTGEVEPASKHYGFNCGADDYITKPFDLLEFSARVDRLLKRSAAPTSVDLTYSPFLFNAAFQKCYLIEGERRTDLKLTPTEFRLFITLVQNEGQLMSRAFLEREIWQTHGVAIQTRGIDTHIAHLRKKLGPFGSMIVSVYGQGYVFDSKAEGLAAA